VKRGHLEPGDLLFFYQPISHVTIFLGHNKMIEAPHSGARVRVVNVYWQYYTAAARPA
jgi:cell wall-associated NlpC family hydrolase